MGQLDSGAFDYATIDDVTHGAIAISHEHHEIHEGKTFRFYDAITLNSAATQDYLITTPNTTLWSHFTFSIEGVAITSYVLYEGADRAGTAAQTPWNANRNSAATPTTAVHKGTSGGTTDGSALVSYASGSASNQSKGAANSDHQNEIILKQNTKYLLRVTSGTAGNLVNVAFNWYEHTSLD